MKNSDLHKEIQVPPVLYKYRYFDKQNYQFSILESSQLWFSSAKDFNDPFDSILEFDFSDDPKGVIRRCVEFFINNKFPTSSSSQRRTLIGQMLKGIKNFQNPRNWLYENNVPLAYNMYGICSLTSERDNLLMWAHYSDYHKGYCVGLNSKVLLEVRKIYEHDPTGFIDLMPMNYQDEMPRINFFQSYLSDHFREDVITLESIKSNHWKYEKEWRLTYWQHINQSKVFPDNLINSIYLGFRISPENKNKIISMLAKRQIKAEVYETIPSKTKFELIFKRIQ